MTLSKLLQERLSKNGEVSEGDWLNYTVKVMMEWIHQMIIELYVQQAVLETDHVLFFMKPRPKGSFTYDIKLRARFFSPCMKSNQKQSDFLKKNLFVYYKQSNEEPTMATRVDAKSTPC